MSEIQKLDLDARQYIEVRIAAHDYRVYAPSLAETPALAAIGERIQQGTENLKGGNAEGAQAFIEAVADYIAHFNAEIPRAEIMKLDLVRATAFMEAVQALLPKGAASRAPGGN